MKFMKIFFDEYSKIVKVAIVVTAINFFSAFYISISGALLSANEPSVIIKLVIGFFCLTAIFNFYAYIILMLLMVDSYQEHRKERG